MANRALPCRLPRAPSPGLGVTSFRQLRPRPAPSWKAAVLRMTALSTPLQPWRESTGGLEFGEAVAHDRRIGVNGRPRRPSGDETATGLNEIAALRRRFGACGKLPESRLTHHRGGSRDTCIVRRPAAGNRGLLGSRDTAGLQCRENPCGNSNWYVKNGGTGVAGGPLLDPARQNGGPRARAAAGNYDL
jgi:hypothetical protein